MERFWSKVKINDITDCWEWVSSRNNRGYGNFWYNGTSTKAHRMSYWLTFGSLDKDVLVCHKCDNPPCVNPNHLFVGTAQDNVQDRNIKLRHNLPKGENHWKSKLNNLQIIDIRQLYRSGGTSFNKLAKQFNVSKKLILLIVHNKIWKHVE